FRLELSVIEDLAGSFVPTSFRAKASPIKKTNATIAIMAIVQTTPSMHFPHLSGHVIRRLPKIAVAGLVSRSIPGDGNLYPPLTGPTAGRSDDVVTLPVGSRKAKLGSPVSIDLRSVRSSNLDGWKAMQLKHLNLTTSDVAALAAFFERFFGFKRSLE